MPGNKNDWIAISQAYSPADSIIQKVFLNGENKGEIEFESPIDLGEYEIRAYLDWPNGEYNILEKALVSVQSCVQGCLACSDSDQCSNVKKGFFLSQQYLPIKCDFSCETCFKEGN